MDLISNSSFPQEVSMDQRLFVMGKSNHQSVPVPIFYHFFIHTHSLEFLTKGMMMNHMLTYTKMADAVRFGN
jgi:hypothetical protein